MLTIFHGLHARSRRLFQTCQITFLAVGEPAYFKTPTDPDWAPSLKLGDNNVTEKDIEKAVVRNDQAEYRETKKRKIQAEALAARKRSGKT